MSANADTPAGDQGASTSSDAVNFDLGDGAVSVPVDDGSGTEGMMQPRGGETSTKLSNGRLYFEARNGRDLGQSSDRFFSATKYVKSGGSPVKAKLGMELDEHGGWMKYPSAGWLTVRKGDSVNHSWGANRVAGVSGCSVTGMLWVEGRDNPYYTPPENIC